MSEGFLSLSFEVSESEPTYRGEQYCGSWFCLDPEGDAYGLLSKTVEKIAKFMLRTPRS